MRVRSFFSVKRGVSGDTICLQGHFKRVFEKTFTAVHEDIPKCMPEENLRYELKGALFAGSNPAVCTINGQ